ncbi:2'-5' RNA ligase family protein [Gleimia sp. 6138-11-ORH1]|uniref:2'-5' RNA ligase family protein n=1 Tax=Gleimia sp. 6138-11-ORH1 TaxID=2973937 RepID=UPI00216791F1|nr:2'-5' RNA ligase family protein [Gleimia sp. 6138-11-ORH1]MCS4485205.1 2'-5' RNA ligase family protein [Gleimia sp. 6138-11-ORH1]
MERRWEVSSTVYVPACAADEELIGVVIAVPEPWMSLLTEARVHLGDDHGINTPAHITLLPPTAVRKADRERLFEHLQTVAQRTSPFKISLRGTGSFRPVSPVVFFNISEGAGQLTDLEARIRAGITDQARRFAYHPHVTLVHGVSEELMDRAEELGKNFYADWICAGFRLDKVSPDGVYQSLALFNFTE